MSRYDGLIIPRSYSEYINKTDAATLSQALQLSGVMDAAPTASSNKPAKSGGIYSALAGKQATLTFDDTPTANSNNPVKSGGVYNAVKTVTDNISYYTTERFTGKFWTNGKKIYSKTVTCPVVDGDRVYSHGITNIELITHIEGFSESSATSGLFRTLPFVYHGSVDWTCDAYATTSYVAIECGSSFAANHTSAYITLEYTKTTD